jgi:hypothetical protein
MTSFNKNKKFAMCQKEFCLGNEVAKEIEEYIMKEKVKTCINR